MTVSKKNLYKETFRTFVLSPVVVAVLLAAFNPSVNAQTISNFEYLGKWSANPLSPNNPYLDGELIERDSAGAVTGTSDFSKATCTTYGFEGGQDWSFLWAGSTFEEWIKLANNKEMAELYGITADNSVSSALMALQGSLKGAGEKVTRVYVPDTFDGNKVNNKVSIVLPISATSTSTIGASLINSTGTYNFDSPITGVSWGDGNQKQGSTSALISLRSAGTQQVNLGEFGWNGNVLENYIAPTDESWTPQGNVLFMLVYKGSYSTNQTVTGNVGAIATASDHVPGSVTLFQEDGWHLDKANIVMAGTVTNPRSPHTTHGISSYGGGLSNSYNRLEQKFEGVIQSLGTSLHPLGIGIVQEHDQTSGTTKYFLQDIRKVNEIHAVNAGIINDIKGNTFDAQLAQNIEVGKIEVFGDGKFTGAIGVYNRTNIGGKNNSNNSVQRIYVSDSIVVDGFSVAIPPHQYIQTLSTYAAIANRGGRQEIISTNPDQPVLLSAKTQMRSATDKNSKYGTYALLVFPHYQTTPNPTTMTVSFTETLMKGSFDVYNGDIAVFGEQGGKYSKSVGLRLEGQLYPATGSSSEKIQNRLTIADGNNIIVTDRSPLVANSKPSTVLRPDQVRAFLQLRPVTDSQGVEHPYEIEFKGKNSYLNVEGAYLGHGTIVFHSALDFKGDDKWTSRTEFLKENSEAYLANYKNELLAKWKAAGADEKKELEKFGEFKTDALGQDYVVLTDEGVNTHSIEVEKAYKKVFDLGNQLIVNKNPVIIHKVIAQETSGESSRLNLKIDTSNLRKDLDAAYPGVSFASEQPKIQKYFDENAIYILRQAANNVFIHSWTDEHVLLPHQSVLNEKTGQTGSDGAQTKITDDHDEFLDKISPQKKTLESNTETKKFTLDDGTLVEQTITTEKVSSTHNRFTGSPVNNMVAGKVSFTIPEGIITPQRTYVTEYYIENKDNYDANNPYGFNDNEIFHEFLAQYDRNKYTNEFNSKLDVDVSNLAPSEPLKNAEQLRKEEAEKNGGATRAAVQKAAAIALNDTEDPKEGNKVEDDGIDNMGEVYGKVDTYVTKVEEKVTPPEDDCTKYGNCAPDPVDPTPEDPKPVNPNPWDDVTPPTKPDGSLDVGNGCTTSTMDALDSIGLTNYFLWRQENETLYQRLGEVRDNPELEGLWFRGILGKNKWDKGKRHFENKYYGIQIGLDRVHQTFTDEYKCREVDGEGAPCRRVPATDWIYGIGLTYMKGQSKLANGGSGDNWIGTLSFYGTRKFQNGGYLDLIVKGSRLNNEFTAISDQFRYLSKGKYHTYAFQASVEYGNKHYLNKDKTWYIDPELQLTYGHIKGVKYRTFNTLNVDVHNLNSLIGRAGIGVGKEGKKGSAFVKVDALREFKGEYKARYHLDHGAWNKSRISMKDTWGEITIGGTYNFRKDTYGFVQAKRSFASDLKQEYRVDAGIRYVF